jgi:exonuclease III
VWFDDFKQEERYQSILAVLEQSNADVICLQEVTHPFMHKHLLCSEFIRAKYYISGNTLPNYGVLILSKFPSYFYEVHLPSKMKRSMIICEPLVANAQGCIPYAFATCHFESGGGDDSNNLRN